MAPKISYEALERMMADPAVPDRDIAPYLTALRQPSASVMPHVVPDPEKVDMQPIDTFRTMGAGGMRWANNISRWRRQRRFDRRVSNGETLPVIASEGDGLWREYIGGYSDWERVRPSQAAVIKAAKAELRAQPKPAVAAAP